MIKSLVLAIALFLLVESSPLKQFEDDTCAGFKACHPVSKDKLNVHLIPHSHDDVGWLKTVDQYFYGAKTNIQDAGVQYIITSTVEALDANPDRRFIQVETAFFWKWWKQQTEARRDVFRKLVKNGQIEMINGGWSMNDEACAHYQSTIDQFTWGLRIINDTVGPCGAPRIGWQIDPFGHSREQASIFAELGFDAVFFARLAHIDRETRKKAKNMDFLWQGSANLGNTIFGNAFPEPLYYPPHGFCWDCGDAPIIEDPESFENNVVETVQQFRSIVKNFATFYPTNNVLVPMGGDFQYQEAEFNFINMDKLIKAFANDSEINLIYSTPSCYMKAVNEADPKLKLKTDDFFPYSDSDHSYWSGYFTSRPNSKGYERVGHKILQVIKQIRSAMKITNSSIDAEKDLRFLREAMGIMQHHDAITGTEKQAVAGDYVKLLTRGIDTAAGSVAQSVLKFFGLNTEANAEPITPCLLTNISICDKSNADKITVVSYNPLSRPVDHFVRLPIPDGSYTIEDVINGGNLEYDIVDAISDFKYVKLNQKPYPKELVFPALKIPGYLNGLYMVKKSKNATLEDSSPQPVDNLKFGTDTVGFELDSTTNLLKSVTMNGKTVEVTQEFLYYEGHNGDNNGDNKASGAYIFRPLNGNKTATKIAEKATLKSTFKGKFVDEVKQVFSKWVTQIIRVNKGTEDSYIEFDWLVGPIPVDEAKGIGKEIITRFTVKDLNNKGVFYTDSNGREMLKRTRNKRNDFEYDPKLEPISSNYYPVTSKITIKDEDKKLQFSILNDRSQGGSSLTDGQVELMVHRRLLRDDAKGVDEALNEQEFGQGVVVRGSHYLVLGSTDSKVSSGKSTTAKERELALKKVLAPLDFFGKAANDLELSTKITLPRVFKVPDNINVLTLEPWKDDTFILRFEHILEKGDDDNLSVNVTLDLNDISEVYTITEIKETTLAANQLLEDYKKKEKFEWHVKENDMDIIEVIPSTLTNPSDDPMKITLSPMQIRTFIVKMKMK